MRARLHTIIGWTVGLLLMLLRLTFRKQFHHDPRPERRAQGVGYTIAILHAHQIAGGLCNDEKRLHALVSRSADGNLLVPLLTMLGVGSVRGSSRKGNVDKGGRLALETMKQKVSTGDRALIAIDGPRGPRNHVHKGAAELALSTNTAVIAGVIVPRKRWILHNTWDRLQIPQPFTRVDICFSDFIEPQGHTIDTLRAELAQQLHALEHKFDAAEAVRSSA